MGVAAKFITRIQQEFGDKHPAVILDVGSRDLEESIELHTAFPNSRIIAFEPNPSQFQICLEKSKRYSNIEVYEYACGDKEDTIDFWVVDLNVGCSSTLEPIYLGRGWNDHKDNEWAKVPDIKLRRLDNVLSELGVDNVDVVWMDIQGTELLALQGLGKYIDNIKMIHTEAALRPYYKDHIVRDQLESWIRQQGFDIEIWDHQAILNHHAGETDLICIRNTHKGQT